MQDYSKLYKELRNNINTKESPIPITTIPEIKVDPQVNFQVEDYLIELLLGVYEIENQLRNELFI